MRRQRRTGRLTRPSPVSWAPSATSARRLDSSSGVSAVAATPVVASTCLRWVKRQSSGPATYSASPASITTCRRAGRPGWTAATASAPSATIWEAMPSSRLPPSVSTIRSPERVTSGSPRCLRSWASDWETAGSLTPSARAAALTDPSRATKTNAPSWLRVTHPS